MGRHVILVLLLALTIAGMAAGEPLSIAGLGLWPVALAVVYILSLLLVWRWEGIALFLVADTSFREGPILARAGSDEVFLAALATVLTCVFLAGLLLRREKTVLRVGVDSAGVLVLYGVGLVILAAMG